MPLLAESVTEPPAQNVIELAALIVATGKAKTVTGTTTEFVEHPLALVTVTDLFDVLLTATVCVVSPVFHNQDMPAAAVRLTDPPEQKPVGPPAVILFDGAVFTLINTLDDEAEQPFASVTVTVLLVVVFTVINCDVSPVFQTQLLPALAVKFTDPPAQKVVGPFAEILTVGSGLTSTGTNAETAEHPLALNTVTL